MKADIPTDKNETEADKAKAEAVRDRLEDLCERAQAVLSDEVSEVRVSRRLKDSPCCLVTPEGGLHAHIERLLRSQGQDLPKQKRILELNPDHPVVERLHLRNAQADNDPNVTEWLRLLYDQALLAEGSPIPEPARFARRMAELMSKALDAEAGEA